MQLFTKNNNQWKGPPITDDHVAAFRSALAETSIVAGGYRSSAGELARVGVLGPTRMDYSGNIAAVRAVARYLSRLLGT